MTDYRVRIPSIDKQSARTVLDNRKMFDYVKVSPSRDTPYWLLFFVT